MTDARATQPMTSERAAYFLRRFKHDEKMLGPNEQCALDFAIAALAQPATQAEPVGTVRVWNEGGSGEFRTVEGINALPDGTKLYAAPVASPATPAGEPSEALSDAAAAVVKEWDRLFEGARFHASELLAWEDFEFRQMGSLRAALRTTKEPM